MMPEDVLISICIPSYKRVDFLKRLLDSIAIQTFRDFEVIVSDDSPDLAVQSLCAKYESRFPLYYSRNVQPLGTPENWNEAIRRASGTWIKIIHDDDWLVDENSLGTYVQAIRDNPETSFIFSAYRDIFLDEGRTRDMFVPAARFRSFLRNKTVLFARNIIGPPSVVLYKKDRTIEFDKTIKWLVDIDFYIRYLGVKEPVYIPHMLLNVGLGKTQVTVDCFRQRPVEIPENFYILNKVGIKNLRNIIVYDAWWRLMRNLEIIDPEDISGSGYTGPVPQVILSMIGWQKRVSRRFLLIGPFSKTLMFLHYFTHYNRIAE